MTITTPLSSSRQGRQLDCQGDLTITTPLSSSWLGRQLDCQGVPGRPRGSPWQSFTNPVPLGRTPTHMSVYTFGRVFESIQESTLPVTVVLSPLRFIFSQCVAGGPSCVRVAHEHH